MTGRRILLVALAVVFIFAAGCASNAPERATVVWISIDGLRPDYLERANAPLLNRLVAEGVSSRKLIPPTPSLTFPSHVTQATGVPPGVHGIPANSFYDTATNQRYSFPHEAALLQAEPIWLTARRQGVRTLVHDWPLAHAQAGPVRADHFLDRFDPAPSDAQRLDRLLKTWRDDRGAEPLRLLMSYVKLPDVVGHTHGPDSPEVRAAVEETDALLARFVDGVTEIFRRKNSGRGPLYIVLTSDHGMAPVRTMVNFDRLFDAAPPRAVQRITGGTFAMLYLTDVPAAERAALQSQLLRDLRHWNFLSVYTRATLPQQWGLAHPTRVGDIVVTLRPGYHLSDRLPLVTFPVERVGSPRGAHGYVPAESSDMNALCVIWRYPNRLKRCDLGAIRAEQMHATAARLLNINPAKDASAAPVFDP